jgi:hypothetical protein
MTDQKPQGDFAAGERAEPQGAMRDFAEGGEQHRPGPPRNFTEGEARQPKTAPASVSNSLAPAKPTGRELS